MAQRTRRKKRAARMLGITSSSRCLDIVCYKGGMALNTCLDAGVGSESAEALERRRYTHQHETLASYAECFIVAFLTVRVILALLQHVRIKSLVAVDAAKTPLVPLAAAGYDALRKIHHFLAADASIWPGGVEETEIGLECWDRGGRCRRSVGVGRGRSSHSRLQWGGWTRARERRLGRWIIGC